MNIYLCICICLLLSSFHSEILLEGEEPTEYVAKIRGAFTHAKFVQRITYAYSVTRMVGFDDIYIFRYNKKRKRSANMHHKLLSSPYVQWAEKQVLLKRTKRSSNLGNWNDPLFPDMWYLVRASQGKGYDMNVFEAWSLGYTGKGVVCTILDDGVDYTHPDLEKSYDPLASYDINGGDNDPMPNLQNRANTHGTRCAGQIAAQGNNSVCVVGIAYNSRIGGIRMLDGLITDRVEAESLSYNRKYIDIYSGSWGPDDEGLLYEGPGRLAQAAFERGVKEGRNGFGNIYVWASGNGGTVGDSCACDGYVSSPYTLSVSGVTEYNRRPWYSERCSSTLVSTYSSGGPTDRMIYTIDSNHQCTSGHTGTSASAPMAAGIIALLLEAN